MLDRAVFSGYVKVIRGWCLVTAYCNVNTGSEWNVNINAHINAHFRLK